MERALDTVDEIGYVVAYTSKADGYISTEVRENFRYRDKFSLRVEKLEDGSISVSVTTYSQFLSDPKNSYREDTSSSGYFEDDIKNRIGAKLKEAAP